MQQSISTAKQFRFNKYDYAQAKPFIVRQKMYDHSTVEYSTLANPVSQYDQKQIERKFLTPNPLRLPSCCQTYMPHNPISVQFFINNSQKPNIDDLKKQDNKFYKYMKRLNKPKPGKVKSELYEQMIKHPVNTSFISMDEKTEQFGFLKNHSLEGFKRSASATSQK
ncbi:Hypothetical_protein [Hexamita inflata]|uniref:Hypothetical_protein n=1 Tax=Hexamita inflata TaxID=28002 RepID=A0AA86PX81_9EUKA|nr:Hypothetical protein HINF_LOCUS34151 [Hexamita inflata]